MDLSNLSREELVDAIGEKAVSDLEGMSCEPTGKLLPHGVEEWTACLRLGDILVKAVYYTDEMDAILAAEAGWDYITYTIPHFEIV